MNTFNKMITYLALIDIGFKGPKLTWSNKPRWTKKIRERIDRALEKSEWIMHYPTYQIQVHATIGSDHTPLILHPRHNYRTGRRRFQFEEMWLEHNGCRM